MISRLIFKDMSSCSAKRRLPCLDDLPHCSVSGKNQLRVPTLYHAQGVVYNFHYSHSLQSSNVPNRLLQDVTGPSASPFLMTSLDALTQNGNTSREMMDAPACAGVESSSLSTGEINALASGLPQEPHAELCAAGRACVTAEQLGSVTALADWLKDRLPLGHVQTLQWGKLPGTKTVANLWLELSQGEISLEDSRPPIRTVHVACVRITNGSGKVLLESHQEMADGSRRERNRPLSEKMKPGETVEEACLRGIIEELGSELGSPKRVTILQPTYNREVQGRESFSYPGLMTYYVLHHMEAVMKHLPADDFSTEENELCHDTGVVQSLSGSPECGDENCTNGCFGSGDTVIGVKRHFWKWVPELLN